MSSETKPARWKVILGYAAFALVAFVLGLFLTFPYDTVRTRIVNEAAQSGLAVRIGSLRPGLGGITATHVRVSKPPAPLTADTIAALARGEATGGAAELGEAVVLDSVAVRPSLFPPGVAVRASAMDGTIHAVVGGLGDLKVRMELDGVDVSGGNLPAFTGLDMAGEVDGVLNLTLPRGKSPEPDLSLANGELSLDTRGLVIKGGTVTMALMPGMPPGPVDLKRFAPINLGALTGRIQFEKGLGTVQTLRLKGDDIEAMATGTLKLGKKLEYSEPGMDVNLKLDAEAQKRMDIIALGLNALPADKKDPSFRAARFAGFLNRPTFTARR